MIDAREKRKGDKRIRKRMGETEREKDREGKRKKKGERG